MSTWHAYASCDALTADTEVLVTGGSERIRLETADRLSIEMPGHNRLSAVVVDRRGQGLLLTVDGGPLIRLRRTAGAGAFGDFKLSDGFSRQGWTVQ
jgi:hypothetical protein